MYQMNPTSLFTSKATNYALYRPSYSAEAINYILEGLQTRSPLIAADIGAGTGIGSRLLGESGVKVIAIEPNDDMRHAATPHPMVELRSATAEATGLADASVDLITCFQSFHWFDPVPTLSEFHRILKPSGRLALVWCPWDDRDPFSKEFDSLVVQAAKLPQGLLKPETMVKPMQASSYFHKVQEKTFPYTQYLDFSGLIGLVQSLGSVRLSDEEQQQLIAELRRLYEQWADSRGVSVVYRTHIYLAERV